MPGAISRGGCVGHLSFNQRGVAAALSLPFAPACLALAIHAAPVFAEEGRSRWRAPTLRRGWSTLTNTWCAATRCWKPATSRRRSIPSSARSAASPTSRAPATPCSSATRARATSRCSSSCRSSRSRAAWSTCRSAKPRSAACAWSVPSTTRRWPSSMTCRHWRRARCPTSPRSRANWRRSTATPGARWCHWYARASAQEPWTWTCRWRTRTPGRPASA